MSIHDNTDDDDELQQLIADFLDAANRGEPVDREALLRQHPEHADSMNDFFIAHDRMISAAVVDPSAPSANTVGNEDVTLASSPEIDDDATLASVSSTKREYAPSIGDVVRYVGDYELLEEVARGGMGVVFKARQVKLNRVVALKMILAGQFAGAKDVQRFYTEAESAAQLDHPGIVPIFEIGQHQGQHYFSMGYVEGESLAERIADGPLAPHHAADLVAKVCNAMAYAHERGVIHRDLKPSNILIDLNGEPRVTDFGLAKRTEADSGMTGTGQILGTPAYMPPEQANTNGAEVGPLADVYSLGAVLYCLLTGRPPFQAASVMDTLLQVVERDAIKVRQLVPTTPRDLETICGKCLNKDPLKRYASAKDLSDDLRRFLANEPIEARSAGWIERASKWGTKQPIIAAILLSMPAWMLGEPKIGIGLLALVAGFHLPFRFRWIRLLCSFAITVFLAMAIGGKAISETLADHSAGANSRIGAIWGLATTTPFFVALLMFLWDCVSKLQQPYQRRVRRWLIASILFTIASAAGLLLYLKFQGQEISVVSEQLAKEHYSVTQSDVFSAFGGDSSAAQTQLARGRMFLWFPAVAGTAWIYLVWGTFAGRLIRRFVYLPTKTSTKSEPLSRVAKTVDGDVSRWVAIAVAVACAVAPFAVDKLLKLYNVDFSTALEMGSILNAMMFIGLAAAWLAAYAVASRRFVTASIVGSCLVLFLAVSTGGTIASRMYLFKDPPAHITSQQTAMRWDGVRRGLVTPEIVLEKQNGITIEGWMKPEGIPKTNVGCDPILVENTSLGNIKFGIKLTQAMNWVGAARRAFGSAIVAAAPDDVAFDKSLKDAKWTHFAAVIRADGLVLFINGQRVANEKPPDDWFFPQVWVVVLGGNPVKADRSLVGLLDEIRVSDTARYDTNF